jgi:5-methylcytosine-specific restriction endonuclease McrA
MNNERFIAKEWLDKRKQILSRDNYTCQNCKSFNPSLGLVEYYRPDDNGLELHEYESSPGTSFYRISSEKNGITVEMDFGLNWLVLPTMQIHHKLYIENRQLWEYEDSHLVTLCKDCHTLVHKNIDIPLFNDLGILVDKKKYPPEEDDKKLSHDFVPWIFINMDYGTREYKLATVNATLGIFIMSSEFDKIEEIRTEALNMYEYFMEKFLPRMNNGIFYKHD